MSGNARGNRPPVLPWLVLLAFLGAGATSITYNMLQVAPDGTVAKPSNFLEANGIASTQWVNARITQSISTNGGGGTPIAAGSNTVIYSLNGTNIINAQVSTQSVQTIAAGVTAAMQSTNKAPAATNADYAERAATATNAQTAVVSSFVTGTITNNTSGTAQNAVTAAHVSNPTLTNNTSGTHSGPVSPSGGSASNLVEYVEGVTGVKPFQLSTNYALKVFSLTATGSISGTTLSGALHGTNISAGTINSNSLDAPTLEALAGGGSGTASNVASLTDAGYLTNWNAVDPNSKANTNDLGTAAWNNVEDFAAPFETPTNANYIEVWHNGAPTFGVETNSGGTFANGILITNVTRAAIVGQVAKDDEQDSRIDSLANLTGGGGTATNVFSLNWLGTHTNNEYTAVLTNAVSTNHTTSGTAWVRGAGATNAYYGRLDWAYFKGITPLWAYSSNVLMAAGGLEAYVTTNAEANIVFSLKGATDETINWSIKGFSETSTNGSAVSGTPPEVPPTDLANNLFVFLSFDAQASATTWTNSVNGAVYYETGTLTNDTVQKVVGDGAIGGFTGQIANYLTITPDIDAMSPIGANKVFIMGWFRPGETNNTMGLVTKSTLADPNREWVLRYDSTHDTIAFAVYPDGSAASAVVAYAPTNALYRQSYYFFAGGFSVPDGEVYATYGTTNIDIPTYSITTNSVTYGAGVNTTTGMRVGQYSGGGYPLNGRLDELAIYTNWIPTWEEVESFRTNTLAGRSYPSFTP